LEQGLRWLLRFIVAVATAFSGFVISLDTSSLEKHGWWRPSSDLVFISMALISAGIIWQFIDAEWERRRVRRRNELRTEINSRIFPAWYKISTVGVNRATRERIGVHVWMVPTWHWHLVPEFVRRLTPKNWRGRLPTPKMWRACNLRLKEDDHDGTDIAWTRDIGAIGLCWRDRDKHYFELPSHWGDSELSEEQWDALDQPQKLGLKYPQYKRIRAKYFSVLVWPIFKDSENPESRFIGCVVVDSLSSHPVNLNIRKVRLAMYRASKEISKAVVPIAS
jgi:hypothetical protein